MANWRAAKSITTLRKQLNEMFPNRSKVSDGIVGDLAHSKRASDHNPNSAGVVTAFDITHDPKTGVDCHKLAAALQTARDPRIKYLIWNGQITQKTDVSKWKRYTGSNPHKHHLHISVSSDARLYDDAGAWKLDGLRPKINKTSQVSAANSETVRPPDAPGVTNQNEQAEVIETPVLNNAIQIPQTEPPPIENQAVETSQTQTVQTEEKKTETEVSIVNEQDVNQTEKISGPEPYNGVGFWQTIKTDLTKVGVGNGIIQSASEYAEKAQTWPEWVVAIVIKLAYIVAVVSVGYLIFRVIHYLVDRWQKNQKSKTQALVNTDITRKNMVWK